jgi:hypothetical protein
MTVSRKQCTDVDSARRYWATLQRADGHQLPFDDGSFGTVVCSSGSAGGVLRPDGRLILVDHIESSSAVARAVQRFLELFTVPSAVNIFGA